MDLFQRFRFDLRSLDNVGHLDLLFVVCSSPSAVVRKVNLVATGEQFFQNKLHIFVNQQSDALDDWTGNENVPGSIVFCEFQNQRFLYSRRNQHEFRVGPSYCMPASGTKISTLSYQLNALFVTTLLRVATTIDSTVAWVLCHSNSFGKTGLTSMCSAKSSVNY